MISCCRREALQVLYSSIALPSPVWGRSCSFHSGLGTVTTVAAVGAAAGAFLLLLGFSGLGLAAPFAGGAAGALAGAVAVTGVSGFV